MKTLNTLSSRSLRTIAATAAVLTVGGTALVAGPAMAESQPERTSAAQQAAPTTGHAYPDGAVVSVPTTWEQGKPLTITGKGFLTKDKKSGSTIAVKLNKGEIAPKNGANNTWLVVTADDKGDFTANLPYPDVSKVGDKIDLYLLSGSLKEGDEVRGFLAASSTVVAPAPAPTTAAPSPSATTAMPSASPTTAAPTTAAPTPVPTTAAPTSPAPTSTSVAPAPVPSTSSAPAEDPTVHAYKDGAVVHFPTAWEPGKPLKITGTGFLTQDRKSGSRIAVKLNKGSISPKSASDGVWLIIDADEHGDFTAELPYPTAENSTLATGLKDGDMVDIYLLSGSLKQGDTQRGGLATTYVFHDAAPAPTSAAPTTTAPTSAAPTTAAPAPSASSAVPVPAPSATTEAPAPMPSASAPETTAPAATTSASADGAGDASVSDQHMRGIATGMGFDNCTQARAAGQENISVTDPNYLPKLDRDNDLVACESGHGNGIHGHDGLGEGAGTAADASSEAGLARTGASEGTATIVAGSLLAVVAGASLLVLARRRRQS